MGIDYLIKTITIYLIKKVLILFPIFILEKVIIDFFSKKKLKSIYTNTLNIIEISILSNSFLLNQMIIITIYVLFTIIIIEFI